MSKLIKINNQNLKIKELNGQKVLIFKDIDMLRERANGTTSRNFNENRFNYDGSERIVQRRV